MTQSVYTIPESYFDFLETHARKLRDKTALEIFSEGKRTGCSFEELYRTVRAIGSGLLDLGVRPGDRVALLAENNPDWGVAFFGIWAAGGICVPLDYHLSDAEVCNLVTFSECRHFFISPKRHAEIRAALGSAAEKVCFVTMPDPEGEGEAPTFKTLTQTALRVDVPYKAAYEDIAVIQFTSGTSSDPKGVSLSHGNILNHNAALLYMLDILESDSILGVLPLHHALALNANFLAPLSVGVRITYLPAVTSQSILRGMRDAGITLFACIPQFYYTVHRNILFQVQSKGALVRWSFSFLKGLSRLLRRLGVRNTRWLFPKIHAPFGKKLRLLATAGSYLDPEVVRDLWDMGFGIYQAYGMTESTAAMTVTPVSDNRPGSVGKPMPEVEVKIADPDAQGKGEVIVRGPNVMRGYYKRPDLTAETIRDGWLHTGDLGYFDADGHLYITGRIKDVIVLRNGKNIYPDELERHFLQCPMVREVCVLGIETDDGGGRGEKLHLVAVPDFDYMRAQKIANTGDSIRFEMESLSRKLPSHKHITSMEVLSEPLPRTTTQKIRRGLLKRQVEARLRAGIAAAAAAPLRPMQTEPLKGPHAALVSKMIQLQKKPAFELSARHNLELDLGFDSLERLELLSAIEQQAGLQVTPELIPNIYTLQDLLDALEQSTSTSGSNGDMAVVDRRSWSRLLASSPDDAAEQKHFLDSKPVMFFVSFLLLKVFYCIAKVTFRLKVTGLENLRRDRPFLICPNHLSYIDAFLVCACLPFEVLKHVFFVGFSEYFQGRLSSWFGRTVNVIPIDPDAKLYQAMRLAAEGLRHNKILCIFPEGSRSIDGRLQAFHRGSAILAADRQAPMIPVGLIGPYEVWPRDSWRIRFHPLKVNFGEPVFPMDDIPDGEPYPYDQLTEQLRHAVSRLIR
jgi:long-chain acyl-CoA synthetase